MLDPFGDHLITDDTDNDYARSRLGSPCDLHSQLKVAKISVIEALLLSCWGQPLVCHQSSKQNLLNSGFYALAPTHVLHAVLMPFDSSCRLVPIEARKKVAEPGPQPSESEPTFKEKVGGNAPTPGWNHQILK